MFERFTERARQVVVLAQEEARNFHHTWIGTEHILLGLVREEEGLGARVLEQLGVGLEGVREEIVRLVGDYSDKPSQDGQIPFTPKGKKVLELSLREALSLGHNYIGTEHILLGLVREGWNEPLEQLDDLGVAMRILTGKYQIGIDIIRAEVIRKLSAPVRRQRLSGPADEVDVVAGSRDDPWSPTLKTLATIERSIEDLTRSLRLQRSEASQRQAERGSQLVVRLIMDLSADERLTLLKRRAAMIEVDLSPDENRSKATMLVAEELLRDGHAYHVISAELL